MPFQTQTPPVSENSSSSPVLHPSLSARQLERKDRSRPSSASLALYQEAIHQLLPELQTRNTAVVASCVVLCVLEMMSCKHSIGELRAMLTFAKAHQRSGGGISTAVLA